MQDEQQVKTRSLSDIAKEIEQDWSTMKSGVCVEAQTYLDAMKTLQTMSDSYFLDSARAIVMYFLANARTWRGKVARRVKIELKSMLDASI